MPSPDRTSSAAPSPDIAKSLELYDRIATAQRTGKAVAIPSTERPTGPFARFKSIRDNHVSTDHALMLAQEQLKTSVVRKHGQWGWKQLVGRVPELRTLPELHLEALRAGTKPLSDLGDADDLKHKISDAYRDVDHLAQQIKRLIGARNVDVDKGLIAAANRASTTADGVRYSADQWAIGSSTPESPINRALEKSILRSNPKARREVEMAFDAWMMNPPVPRDDTRRHLGFTEVEADAIARLTIAKYLLSSGNEGRFDNYEAGLEILAESLVEDFAPPSAGWGLASRVAGDELPLNAKDYETLPLMLRGLVRESIRTQGKLPSREAVFNMAVKLACEHGKQPVQVYFGRHPNAVDLGMYGEGLGRADFPTRALQDQVEGLAGTMGADADSVDLSTVLPRAMMKVWGQSQIMLDGYGERLSADFAKLDARAAAEAAAGTYPDVSPLTKRESLESEKLDMMMPGSKLFEYLRAKFPDPELGLEAQEAYRKMLLQHLTMGQTDGLGFRAQAAYVEAQAQEAARVGPKDAGVLAMLSGVLQPKFAKAMADAGRVDTLVEATPDIQRSFLQKLSEVGSDVQENGYSNQFMLDLHRANWVLKGGGDDVIIRPGPPDSVRLAQYEDFFAGNLAASKTLSHVLHQNNIGLIMKDWEVTAHSLGDPAVEDDRFAIFADLDAHPSRTSDAFNFTYTLHKVAPNSVEVEYNCMRASDTFLVRGTYPVPMNRGADLQGAVSGSNAAVIQKLRVLYDINDLAAGILNPRLSQVPQTELHLAPDWGLISSMRRDGTLRLPS